MENVALKIKVMIHNDKELAKMNNQMTFPDNFKINNVQFVDDIKITEMCIDDNIYYIYNNNKEYANIIHQISDNLEIIIDNIQQFLQQKLEQGYIQTVNNEPLFIDDEHILLFSSNEISLHFTQTNIIGALEVGIMVDLCELEPMTYHLLDENL